MFDLWCKHNVFRIIYQHALSSTVMNVWATIYKMSKFAYMKNMHPGLQWTVLSYRAMIAKLMNFNAWIDILWRTENDIKPLFMDVDHTLSVRSNNNIIKWQHKNNWSQHSIEIYKILVVKYKYQIQSPPQLYIYTMFW